jgi:hypothetical protein
MLNFNPELYTYTIDKNGKRRKKYDEADVEKKRIYYLNIVKPKKEKPENPKGRPKNGTAPKYTSDEAFQRAVKATKIRLEKGSCLQLKTMERYGLMGQPFYVKLNDENHYRDRQQKRAMQPEKEKKLLPRVARCELIIKSLLFHVMEHKLEVGANSSFSECIREAVNILKVENMY